MILTRDHWIQYTTLVRREYIRIMRIWMQTLLPPVITQTLYFVIFGNFIGSRIGQFHGMTYMQFLVPGLVMMAVIGNSFGNVVSSFFSTKFQRNIEEVLVSPMPEGIVMAGYVTGGVIRGVMVGGLVFLVSLFFAHPAVHHAGMIIVFALLTSVLLSSAGLLNGILGKSFDDITIFPNFILTPLTYLGGVFYSVQSLPEPWRTVSQINPVIYMINGFRYGFYGFSDVPVSWSLGVLVILNAALIGLNWVFLRRGTGIKA